MAAVNNMDDEGTDKDVMIMSMLLTAGAAVNVHDGVSSFSLTHTYILYI